MVADPPAVAEADARAKADAAATTAALATKLNASAVSGFGATLIDDPDQETARATLGAASTDAATMSTAGLMPAADKTKVDNYQAHANLASAATTDLSSVVGDYITVSGTASRAATRAG